MTKTNLQECVKFRLHPDAVSRKLHGEEVLLQMQSGCYYGLDEIGTKVWDALIAEHLSLGECAARIAEEFSAEPRAVRKDVEALVEDMLKQNLLQLEQV